MGGKAEERRAAWAQDTLPACRAREKAGRNAESHSRVRTGICERPEMRAENNGEVVSPPTMGIREWRRHPCANSEPTKGSGRDRGNGRVVQGGWS